MIEKTVNGRTTRYLYDGPQAIAELQGSAMGVTYLTGLRIDEVLARYAASGNRTLLTDALGSVLALADEAQVIRTRYAYSPYGETRQAGQEDPNPLQYTGRESDDTGLYYYRARYYDPELRRFISSDPIGLVSGPNAYSYVENNPLRYTDPSGLFLGYGLSKMFGRLLGRTPDEIAYGGKIFDVAIGGAVHDVAGCVGGTDIGIPLDLLRGFGGIRSIGLSTATTSGLYGVGATTGMATGAVTLPALFAGYGGYEVGSTFYGLYERYRGNSLGSDLYDLVNHGRFFRYSKKPTCGCQK